MKTTKELAKEYADRCQFLSNFPHDWNSDYSGYIAGYAEAMRWTKLSDDAPTVDKNGEKVLLCRLLNDGQSTQNPSIYPTRKIHLCNPAETWWMEIPKLPI